MFKTNDPVWLSPVSADENRRASSVSGGAPYMHVIAHRLNVD